jgi:hypothetical protein
MLTKARPLLKLSDLHNPRGVAGANRIDSILLLVCLAFLLIRSVPAQQPSREYIRLGGRVIAIENYGLSVSTSSGRTTINPTETVHLAATANVNWSLESSPAGSLANITATSVDYIPPGSPAAPVYDTVTATLQSDSTKTVATAITVKPALCDPNGICSNGKTFDTSSGSGTVAVTSPGAWTVNSSQNWLTFSYTKSADGNGTITYSFSGAALGQNATLTITGGQPSSLAYTITLTSNYVSIGSFARNPIAYAENLGLSASVAGVSGAPVTWSASQGTFSSTTTNPTTYYAPTSGSSPVTVQVTATSQSDTTKSATASLQVSPLICDASTGNCQGDIFSAAGGTGTLNVTKGGSWTIASDSNWVTFPQGSAFSNNQGVAFSVGSGSSRTANICVNASPCSSANASFFVLQNFSVTAPARNVIGQGETAQFTSPAPQGSTVSWSVSPQQGSISSSGQYTAPASIAAGSSPQQVTATAMLVSPPASGSAAVTIQPTICQSSTNCGTAVQVGSQGGSGQLIITYAGSWTAVSNQTWLTFPSGASGTGNGTLTYSYAQNTSGNPARNATITISPNSSAFTVSQGAVAACPSVTLSPMLSYVDTYTQGYEQLTLTPSFSYPDTPTVTWTLVPTGSQYGSIGSTGQFTAQYTTPSGPVGQFTVNVMAQVSSPTCGTSYQQAEITVSSGSQGQVYMDPQTTYSIPANVETALNSIVVYSRNPPYFTPVSSQTDFLVTADNGAYPANPPLADACYMTWVGVQSMVSFADDTGLENYWGYFTGYAINGSGVGQNSQCQLDYHPSTFTYGSNYLFLTPMLTFEPAFVGNQAIYGRVWESGSLIVGWTKIGTVTVEASSVTVSPASAGLVAGQTQQFTATVSNLSPATVTWTINPQVGTISSSGLYTAPPSIATQQTATVTATSQANSAISGSATVTLMTTTPYDLILPTTTMTSGGNSYAALHNITAASGFTISGSATVTSTAGNQITLGPCSGVDPCFSATAGSAGATFNATINPTIH